MGGMGSRGREGGSSEGWERRGGTANGMDG